MDRSTDTIVAPATAPGGPVAIVRLSGPQCRFVCETVAGAVPTPRRATLRPIVEPATKAPIDQALVLFFEAPHSFTGEDCLELQIHGGRAVLNRLLDVLTHLEDVRLAQPGEFTRRALLNGRMDLPQAEALADLISAETEQQRRQALRLLDGQLGQAIDRWRSGVVEALALAEAELDFSDERDVPEGLGERSRDLATSVLHELDSALRTAARSQRIRSGLRVVIAGAPNAGKSSLLNAIARRDVALVSEHAGTTRDVIECRCDLNGYAVTFIDTAGIRETMDPIERLGIDRARQATAEADLVLWLSAPGVSASDVPPGEAPVVQVRTKADLLDPGQGVERRGDALYVSALTGEGLQALFDRVAATIDSVSEQQTVIAGQRQAMLVEQAVHHLRDAVYANLPIELMAESLRGALSALDQLNGRVVHDDVLDAVFGRFCIGK